MDSRWYKDCKTAEDRKQRDKEILSYRNAFEELDKLLVSCLTKKEADRDYDSPGWHHRQIACNEYNQALNDFRKIIQL
jgi:hypothetical protein